VYLSSTGITVILSRAWVKRRYKLLMNAIAAGDNFANTAPIK
jgi:hypothetical protein